ncbi:hypothetical protein [Microbaculum marinisediminis]|uniref:Uncharacterized protein n=1 Tax=Microbaculum marinisediminis TaxID=2931392 RepID=A0AAW5QS25_9HYPH|nr:hypothetical protein [Microbaculum sp. A6E488]MCT8970896.1 hypothetical protein [Microbaculum sp. A6E488]
MQTTSVFAVMFTALWLAALIAFIPWVQKTRHPDSKPLGAYLIFLAVFTITSYAIYLVILALQGAVWPGLLETGLVHAIVVIIVCFLPAFLLASWMIARKPPKAPPLDDSGAA